MKAEGRGRKDFVKFKIRAYYRPVEEGRYGRGDMIQRGQEDASHFSSRWVFSLWWKITLMFWLEEAWRYHTEPLSVCSLFTTRSCILYYHCQKIRLFSSSRYTAITRDRDIKLCTFLCLSVLVPRIFSGPAEPGCSLQPRQAVVGWNKEEP